MELVTRAQVRVVSGSLMIIDPARTPGYPLNVFNEQLIQMGKAWVEDTLTQGARSEDLTQRVLAPPQLLQGEKGVIFRGKKPQRGYRILEIKEGLAIVLDATAEESSYASREVGFIDPTVKGTPRGYVRTEDGVQLITDARSFQIGNIPRSEYAIVPVPNGIYSCQFEGDRLVKILKS